MTNFDASRLSYVLLSRGLITSKDVDFITGAIDFDTWKKYNNENKDNITGRFVVKNMPDYEAYHEEETSTAPEIKPFKKSSNNETDEQNYTE